MILQKQPWDQRFARVLVRPLVGTPVSPNQLTFVTLLLALAGAGLLVPGDPALANWGAGIFVLGRFPVAIHYTGGHGKVVYLEVHPR